jgi:hypothetical protein
MFALGKQDAILEKDVLPVDEFLLSHFLVRLQQPRNGWCYFESLLALQERETKEGRTEHWYETKEELAEAVADELYLNWEFYRSYMDVSFMDLDDNDEVRRACEGVQCGHWNQALGDVVPMAGGKAMNRLQRLFSLNYVQDVLYRDMDKDSPVWNLVNIGDHYDIAVDVSRASTITAIMDEFRPLYVSIPTEDIELVVGEAASRHFPNQFLADDQTWYTVKMRNGTFRSAPYSLLADNPRTMRMAKDINRLSHIKQISSRIFEKKRDSVETFYLCSITDSSSSESSITKAYISRQILTRNFATHALVKSFDDKHALPNPRNFMMENNECALWRNRMRWLGPRTIHRLPTIFPEDTAADPDPINLHPQAGDCGVPPPAPHVGLPEKSELAMPEGVDLVAQSRAEAEEAAAAGPLGIADRALVAAEEAQQYATRAKAELQHERERNLRLEEIIAKLQRAESERTERERAEKERAHKERADKERADKERADKEHADKERADKERANKERADKERQEERDKSAHLEKQTLLSSCSYCGKASTDANTTYPCVHADCVGWAHDKKPCGSRSRDGDLSCHKCFAKLLSVFQEFQSKSYEREAEEDQALSHSDTTNEDTNAAAHSGNIRSHARYKYSGAIRTPKASVTWYSSVKILKREPLRQGTITSSGLQMHAFANFTSGNKACNLAMVTQTTSVEKKAAAVLMSWLDLEHGSLDTSKCARYTMPRNVFDTINMPHIPRPRNNPFTSVTVKLEPAADPKTKLSSNSKATTAAKEKAEPQKRKKATLTLVSDEDNESQSESDSAESNCDRTNEGRKLSTKLQVEQKKRAATKAAASRHDGQREDDRALAFAERMIVREQERNKDERMREREEMERVRLEERQRAQEDAERLDQRTAQIEKRERKERKESQIYERHQAATHFQTMHGTQ